MESRCAKPEAQGAATIENTSQGSPLRIALSKLPRQTSILSLQTQGFNWKPTGNQDLSHSPVTPFIGVYFLRLS